MKKDRGKHGDRAEGARLAPGCATNDPGGSGLCEDAGIPTCALKPEAASPDPAKPQAALFCPVSRVRRSATLLPPPSTFHHPPPTIRRPPPSTFHSPLFLLLAFHFVTPAMLWWLAAASIPVAIHLWSRRRYREMSWAAMEYLLAALRSSRRRVRLEQWLLLAIRTLLVVLVVIAVAEPHSRGIGLTFVAGERTHRVLVLDGSFSMAYRLADQSRFDQAKQIAARIVQASPQGDGFTLVLMSSPPRVVVGNPVFEARDFLEELENLRQPHTTLDLPGTLAKVEEVLAAARREQPRLTREEVYFLTDLGRVGWSPGRMEPAVWAEARARAQRLAESASLVVLDVGQADAENAAVTELRAVENFATRGHDVHFEARLKHFGRQVKNHQSVEWLVDGRRVKQHFADLAPGAEVLCAFSYRFESPGDHVVEVRLEGDLLEVDNQRYLCVPVKEEVQVLCIDGRPSAKPLRGAAGFLALALAPQDHGYARGPVRAEVAPESALLESDLKRYDCIVLANVAQFTSGEARVLESYLKNGGSLLFFLGDAVLADSYNRQLAGGQVRLLPARLGRVVTKSQHRLDPMQYAHPIVREFRSREKAGLLNTPVHKYYELLIPKESQAKTALRLGDGSPLVVEAPVHRGRVILVATSADTSWTLMPLWPSYVPIVQELLAFAIGGQLQQRNLLVGEALGGAVPAAANDTPVSLQRPDGQREQLRLHSEGDFSAWSYQETSISGVYRAAFGPPLAQSDAYAVNVDTAESDLARLSPEELRDEIWPGVRFVHQTQWDDTPDQAAGGVGRPDGLPKSLLYAVLLLLLVETVLAWRFGHHAL